MFRSGYSLTDSHPLTGHSTPLRSWVRSPACSFHPRIIHSRLRFMERFQKLPVSVNPSLCSPLQMCAFHFLFSTSVVARYVDAALPTHRPQPQILQLVLDRTESLPKQYDSLFGPVSRSTICKPAQEFRVPLHESHIGITNAHRV